MTLDSVGDVSKLFKQFHVKFLVGNDTIKNRYFKDKYKISDVNNKSK